MKKDKQKNRKAVRKEIKLSLIAKLKETIAAMAPENQNIEKEIKKALNKLAKKVSKELEAAQKSDAKVSEKQEAKTAAKPLEIKNQPKPNVHFPKNHNLENTKPAAKPSKPKAAKQ